MVTTTLSTSDTRYDAGVGSGRDGVVRVSFSGSYGTGALIYDGRAVLTAAHLFDTGGGTASVLFQTVSESTTISSSRLLIHPEYNSGSNNDLAIVWLGEAAPTAAERYRLYRETDEVGQSFELVGYGRTGLGSSGHTTDNGTATRIVAQNRFDTDGDTMKNVLGSSISWTPAAGTQLIADFDNGAENNDAIGRLITRSADTGIGPDEGMIAPGDSGSPALINGEIAGLASYIARISDRFNAPDIDSTLNSSFGEIAAWQRISTYQQWIDQSLRAQYTDAPTRAADVQKQVTEGNDGTTLVYFLVEFTGARESDDQIISVDYATRDGTARAGSDYLATSGRLNLYEGETQAVIPVEIIGDMAAEPDEVFYLDVTNPSGGSFGEGVDTLTAARTILNDDGFFF